MIMLHVTIYDIGAGDQFKVLAQQGDDPEELTEITDQYEVTAIRTEDNRAGFAVIRRSE